MKYALILALSVLSITSNTAKQTSINTNHIYSNVAKVIELDRENDIVTCIDGIGYEWEFSGCEDWQMYDYCSMVMYDNNTSLIFDDVIIDVKYEIIPR